jgi:ABC-type Fe3+-siderophore transport system permease subunit
MATHTASVSAHRERTHIWPRIVDTGTYWAGIASVYIAYGFLWFYSFKEKLFDNSGHMPTALAKGYQGTFIDSFPGLNTTWAILGGLEALAFVAIIASLVGGEFLPQRRKPILLSGLAFSMFVFAVMTFGQNLVNNYDGVASLFTYMGVTAVVYGLLRFVPLFRGEEGRR